MSRPLRAYRTDAGLTLKMLAERAGLSETTVTLADEGKRIPRRPTRKKIADALSDVLGYPVAVTAISEFARELPRAAPGLPGSD